VTTTRVMVMGQATEKLAEPLFQTTHFLALCPGYCVILPWRPHGCGAPTLDGACSDVGGCQCARRIDVCTLEQCSDHTLCRLDSMITAGRPRI
jgi:hypothetical protein